MEKFLTHPVSSRNLERIKSPWVPLLFLAPLLAFLVFRIYETELTALIIPLFPDEADKSFGFYRDFLELCFNEMLWQSMFLLMAWAILVYTPIRSLMLRVETSLACSPTVYMPVLLVVTATLLFAIAYQTLDTFPNSADEYVYRYQAETLSQGRLAQTAHPLGGFFQFNHIGQKDGVSVGRFPPGWPLLLSVSFFLHFPAVWVNPLLALITLFLFHSFAKRYYGPRVAFWSLISLAFSGFFLFNSASFFSHTSCLLFTVGFVYCLRLSDEKHSDWYACLAGVLLGMVVITRYFTAVLIFLPVLIAMVYRWRWRSLRPLFFIGLGCLPLFGFLFWYDYRITGNPLLPVTVWIDPGETLGFVKGHTFMKAMEHLIRRMLLFLYWSSPALLLLYVVFLFQKLCNKVARLIHPEDYYMLLLTAGYFFYYHLGGNQYGPRFLYEAYPFMIVFVVYKAFAMKAKWPIALFAAGLIYAVVKLPYIMAREHRVVRERLDLYTSVKSAGISNAVVFISTPTSIIRPMPPSDLVRNDMNFQNDVLYAHDRGAQNITLMEYYPSRTFYKYVRDSDEAHGALIRLDKRR